MLGSCRITVDYYKLSLVIVLVYSGYAICGTGARANE